MIDNSYCRKTTLWNNFKSRRTKNHKLSFFSQLANQSAHILFKSAKRLICFCVHCIILLIVYLIFTLSIYFRQTTRGKHEVVSYWLYNNEQLWSLLKHCPFHVLFNLLFNRNTLYTVCSKTNIRSCRYWAHIFRNSNTHTHTV